MAARFFTSGRVGAFGALFALALAASTATAQQQTQPPAAPPAAQPQPGFFGGISDWWDKQTANWNATWRGMGRQAEKLGQEATTAAQSGVEKAKEAADTVGRVRNTTVIAGNEKCTVAPNGAPNCVAAAQAMCKAKGFQSGQSLDMTSAEECPPKVYMSGRNTGPECTSYTFVSRALCQ
jgi:hypothetical protein